MFCVHISGHRDITRDITRDIVKMCPCEMNLFWVQSTAFFLYVQFVFLSVGLKIEAIPSGSNHHDYPICLDNNISQMIHYFIREF